MATEADKDKPLGLPRVDPGMNKIAPVDRDGGKGAKKPKGKKRVLPAGAAPALSDTNEGADEPDDDDAKQEGDTDIKLSRKEKEALLSRIRKRMERCISAESDNRKAALEDLKFKAGDQWPADIQAQRNFDKRPCLTVNRMKTFVHQVTNEQRENRPAINISPVGDRGDPEVAKMFRGLIRSIERHSSADIAYDTAFDGAVSNGFGYWRILTEYESDGSFDQVIVIKRIRNPFTVYLDPDRQEPDGADSMFGFVTELIPRDEFEERWPNADPMPFAQGGIGESMKNWATSDSVRVAEYFEIQNEPRTLVRLSNGHVGWKADLSEQALGMIERHELTIDLERESECPAVTWYKVTAKDVLESKPWKGRWVPVVQCIGDEIDIEGKVKLSGLIRDAKDPQRMFNYWRTSSAELIALAPKAPWLMEEGQVEGHEQQWKQANVKSYPYLLYKNVNVAGGLAPPPQRQAFAGVPAGVVQASVDAANDMMATTGIRFDSTPQERVMDESGRALREHRRTSDIGSFHYVDNLSRSLKHTGRILLDLIPKIYDTKRVLTILREDDTEERIQLDPSAPKGMQERRDPQTGKTLKIFNPTFGEYGVTVTIGPSYATKRIEAAESMMDFARAMPNIASAIADLIAKNQDWPGSTEMATRLAKVVAQAHPGVMSPDIKDVPPQVQALLTQLDQQVKALTQERMALMKELNDKQADRAVQQSKIDKDFEAKLLGIVASVETKMAAVQEKAVANLTTHIRAIEENATALAERLSKPAKGAGEE